MVSFEFCEGKRRGSAALQDLADFAQRLKNRVSVLECGAAVPL
jgi:hypothetical protein